MLVDENPTMEKPVSAAHELFTDAQIREQMLLREETLRIKLTDEIIHQQMLDEMAEVKKSIAEAKKDKAEAEKGKAKAEARAKALQEENQRLLKLLAEHGINPQG